MIKAKVATSMQPKETRTLTLDIPSSRVEVRDNETLLHVEVVVYPVNHQRIEQTLEESGMPRTMLRKRMREIENALERVDRREAIESLIITDEDL